jgi:hypothetical protein
MSSPWATPPETMNRRPAFRPTGLFLVRTIGEIVGVVALCALILTCAWAVILYRS